MALRCGHVTVVEPSTRIAKELRRGAMEANITNISVVSWVDAKIGSADMVLWAGIVGGVPDIGPFIRMLESCAKERVVVLACSDASPSQLTAVWRTVHGVDRVELPAVPEFLNALREMDIHPNLEMLDAEDPEAFPDWQAALEFLRQFLYVKPDTLRDQHLRVAMNTMVVETPNGFTIKGFGHRRPALISWVPTAAKPAYEHPAGRMIHSRLAN